MTTSTDDSGFFEERPGDEVAFDNWIDTLLKLVSELVGNRLNSLHEQRADALRLYTVALNALREALAIPEVYHQNDIMVRVTNRINQALESCVDKFPHQQSACTPEEVVSALRKLESTLRTQKDSYSGVVSLYRRSTVLLLSKQVLPSFVRGLLHEAMQTGVTELRFSLAEGMVAVSFRVSGVFTDVYMLPGAFFEDVRGLICGDNSEFLFHGMSTVVLSEIGNCAFVIKITAARRKGDAAQF